MHSFSELAQHCAEYTLKSLNDTHTKIIEGLENSGATTLVRALQMISLQKSIFAVGMLSMFEAALQEGLQCENGFSEADNVLEEAGETTLKERFDSLRKAINVLKHGKGSSYEALLKNSGSIAFQVKPTSGAYFSEGDVSEISTLVDVDDEFVLSCADVIRDVTSVIRTSRPHASL